MCHDRRCRLAMIALLLVTGGASAESQPDFSSAWYFQPEQSEPADVGGRVAALKLKVIQEEGEIAIDRTYNSFAVYEDLLLDGTESESEFRSTPRITKASWLDDGQTL